MKDTDNFTEFPVFHSRDSYAHEDYYGPRYHQQVEILRIKAIMCKRKAEKAMEAAKAAKLAAIQYETGGVDPSLV